MVKRPDCRPRSGSGQTGAVCADTAHGSSGRSPVVLEQPAESLIALDRPIASLRSSLDQLVRQPDDGREQLHFALWDEDTAFAVCSPGYRAWVAHPGAPDFPATADGRVVVRLQRDWSQLFLARKRARGSPLAGVEIRLDGRPAGRTDARSELWVHAEAAALELEVTHPFLAWTEEAWAPLDEHVTWLALHP